MMDKRKIDNAQLYKVTLTEPITVLKQTFYPHSPLTLRGDIVKQHSASISRAEAV